MSDAGLAFLKCAFAPPDFNVDPGKGIPDAFQGKTFTDKNSLTAAITPTAGNDTYYVFAPTPGVAYWTCSVTTGTVLGMNQAFTPVYWPGNFGAGNIFGADTSVGTYAANVDAFRYASICAGLYPTSPFTTTAGSITVWKTRLNQAIENYTKTFATTPSVSVQIGNTVVHGLEALNTVSRDAYGQGAQQGVYSVATCNEPDFEFTPILEGYNAVPMDAVASYMFGRLNGPFLGVGHMDTIIMKVTIPTGASTSFLLRAWSCVEYSPVAGTVYDRFSHISPPLDEVALAAYRKAAINMPVAVVAAENAHFWQTILNILQGVARVGSYTPGPIGVVSSVADVLIGGIKGLMAEKRK